MILAEGRKVKTNKQSIQLLPKFPQTSLVSSNKYFSSTYLSSISSFSQPLVIRDFCFDFFFSETPYKVCSTVIAYLTKISHFQFFSIGVLFVAEISSPTESHLSYKERKKAINCALRELPFSSQASKEIKTIKAQNL